ncbi:Mov34/MPN/PAD-1 family protein [Burkholderia pseudomallei]|uniref:Mov34/MPN/PAD-1 family protein n=1 Tax=Burkholderia pseudomallei TaxID=28450 RepID=UPI0005392C02|nr:Mov34/MPN/PAD-1 family protein [Burkholderia pseudomallei]APZ18602.1 hypothetical protein BGI47_08030 [Burkholderia pseudomallei]APZ24796.1 hypothetical protein BGI46_08025 [Burkholderia pseudomallei]KGW35646.1 hypothetical protein Y045_5465 [Burkholderia pseudomallei MSHR2451]MBM5619478.1 hypothetical protein [Burkholderia pseudomallei]MBM5633233.1 hypothetical protein [Burkholderia pseudomallei]
MNTFEHLQRFLVPRDLADETDRLLREAGRSGVERFVLWSGTMAQATFQVRTLHMPRQTAFKGPEGLSVRIDGPELHRLNVWLYEHEERLAVQVHSHPTEAFHSDTDDRYPMVTTRGGLSLVVPDFARRGVRGIGTALYRLDENGWYEIDAASARALLEFQP